MTDKTRELLQVVQQLVNELHPDVLSEGVELDSSLDRDLGLDSLARMELLSRLENQFAIRLPEQILATAETPRDLLRHIDRQETVTPLQHDVDRCASSIAARSGESQTRPSLQDSREELPSCGRGTNKTPTRHRSGRRGGRLQWRVDAVAQQRVRRTPHP